MKQYIHALLILACLLQALPIHAMQVAGRFAGKKALITGGTQGIGLAVAKEFVRRGGNAIVTSRSKENITKALSGLEHQYQGKIHGVFGDLTNALSARELFKSVQNQFGAVDVLINNAGLWEAVKFVDVSDKQIDDNLDVLKGTFFLTQAVAKHWIEKKIKGAIVNIGSASVDQAIIASPCTPHVLQKAGLHALGKSIGVELAAYGIRTNTISLGTVGTIEYQRTLAPEIMALYPLQRIGTFEEVANLAVTLADDSTAGWMTGSVVDMSGGQGASR